VAVGGGQRSKCCDVGWDGTNFDAATAAAASIVQLAVIIEKIAAGARGHDHSEISGFAIKGIIAAIRSVVP
jgi:hypothetical protein